MNTNLETLIVNADRRRAVNFVFVAEGYTAAEMPKFRAEALKLWSYVLKQHPFARYTSKLNAFMLPVVSSVSGISDGVSGVVKQTPFLAQQNYGGTARVIGGMADRRVLEAVSPHFDQGTRLQIVLLCNTTAYGGSGGAVVYVSRHADAGKILAHELGHSLFKLRDEYTTELSYWPRMEGPNLSLTPDPKLVPWSMEIGMPDGVGGTVGIFEGGGYHRKGIWRATKAGCGMATLGKPLCRVCRIHAEKIMEAI